MELPVNSHAVIKQTIMEQFKIRKDGFKEIRKALIVRGLSVVIVAVFGAVAMSYFDNNYRDQDVNVLPFVIPLLLVAVWFALNKAIKKQKEIFESYILTINDNSIVREAYNTPTITIANGEVREITRDSKGNYIIKGNSSLSPIAIPSQIENSEKFEALLSEIKPMSIKTREPFFQKFRILFLILTFGLMAGVYVPENKIIVGVSGIILLALMGYSSFTIQKNKNIDYTTKRKMWWVLIVVFSIIGMMYMKLTA
ncbi:hypothetical protein HYN59_08445 [Flavobacterium album]|uniref:Uncharacterized protein n=1 Tax=Flavobacterium album TaxID=2175091 RepID=A0A2S1QXT4_9FLAO|nr:hypothetical protein [Flavobacterium album]AWH85149.1 hypothetical protein HYN59_08445 [Flavobacterium album]